MEHILLDTNMIIYREGEKELDQSVQLLSRLLLDSNKYKLCIHPLSRKELQQYKDVEKRNAILSKLNVYPSLQSPPLANDEFCQKCGCGSRSNDYIDNCMIYAVYMNCVTYLITNDKGIHKKGIRLNLQDRILSIESAIDLLSKEKDITVANTPVFINEEFLYNINTDDAFFDSLREDYKGFDSWINRKKKDHSKAFVTYLDNNKIGAFLMLKVENESEIYDDFETEFCRAKRIKISTFKVIDNGKAIGEAFIKVIINYALNLAIDEIYVTAFKKQEKLIDLLIEYGFHLFTYKNTKLPNDQNEKEGVYVKRLFNGHTDYPVIYFDNQNVFLVPIRPEFSKRLFSDAYMFMQYDLFDITGESTCSNVIKKAYISKAKIKGINSGDILVFYFSDYEKKFVSVGVVDESFRANEIDCFDNFKKIVKRRTVYEEPYLKEAYDEGYLIILFKYYLNLKCRISYETAKKEELIKGPPQTIQRMDIKSFKKLVYLSGSEKQIQI